MHVAILRRVPNASQSMDVYADNLIQSLRTVRPEWKVTSHHPRHDFDTNSQDNILLRGVKKYYRRFVSFPNSLPDIKADIFHVIDQSDGYLCRFLNSHNIPSIVTCHDIINLTNPETFKNRAILPSISMKTWLYGVHCMQYADKIISVSNFTKKEIINHLEFSENNIESIPNAVNQDFRQLTPDERYKVRQSNGISDNIFCLLNVGSNNSRKNINTILEVVTILTERGNNILFLKAGTDFDDLQRHYIEVHQIGTSVRYVGQPNIEELIGIYNSADCLLAPSFCEGFGMTILEAMACGTPVITSNLSAMPEVTGDAGILIDPNDKHQISEEIESLIDRKDKKQHYIKKGLERVRNFSWEDTAKQVAKVYEEVLHKT